MQLTLTPTEFISISTIGVCRRIVLLIEGPHADDLVWRIGIVNVTLVSKDEVSDRS